MVEKKYVTTLAQNAMIMKEVSILAMKNLKDQYGTELEQPEEVLNVVSAFMDALHTVEGEPVMVYHHPSFLDNVVAEVMSAPLGHKRYGTIYKDPIAKTPEGAIISIQDHADLEIIDDEVFDFGDVTTPFSRYVPSDDEDKMTLLQLLRSAKEGYISDDDGQTGAIIQGKRIIHSGRGLDLSWFTDYHHELKELQEKRGRIHILWANR